MKGIINNVDGSCHLISYSPNQITMKVDPEWHFSVNGTIPGEMLIATFTPIPMA